MVAWTRATKTLALVGVGILLLFVGYLGWQYQVCDDLRRGPGAIATNATCDPAYIAYPWRDTYILGLTFFLGFASIIASVILLAKVERADARNALSNRSQDNQVGVD